jgi:hypothetical protein
MSEMKATLYYFPAIRECTRLMSKLNAFGCLYGKIVASDKSVNRAHAVHKCDGSIYNTLKIPADHDYKAPMVQPARKPLLSATPHQRFWWWLNKKVRYSTIAVVGVITESI